MASRVPLSSLSNGTILQSGSYRPAVGATAYVYTHGTTTQVSVYAAETGASTITQPLSVNGDGQLPGWINPAQRVDIVATFAGVTATASVLDAVSGDDLRVIKEGPLNVQWAEYGAKGDAVTDDTAAINAAITAANTGGNSEISGMEILFPPADYLVNGTLNANQTFNLSLRSVGNRYGAARLKTTNASGTMISARSSGGFGLGKGLVIEATNAAYAGYLIDMSKITGQGDTTLFHLQDFKLNLPLLAGSTAIGISLQNATAGTIEGLYGIGGQYTIEGLRTSSDFTNSVTIGDGCYFQYQDAAALHNLGYGCRVEKVTFEPRRDGSVGAYLQDPTVPCPGLLTFNGNYMSDGNGAGTWITFNGWALYVVGNLDVAANAILLNGPVRELSVGGYINSGASGNGINFNGQQVRTFRDLGLHGGQTLYTGTSSAVGSGGGMNSGTAAVEVALSASASIPASTLTAVSWGSATYDSLAGSLSPQWAVANPTRLTARAPGMYQVYATIPWASTTSGDRSAWFKVNGTTYRPGSRVAYNPLTAHTIQQASTLTYLNAGDYIECFVFQTTAGALNIDASDPSIGVPAAFGMARIG